MTKPHTDFVLRDKSLTEQSASTEGSKTPITSKRLINFRAIRSHALAIDYDLMTEVLHIDTADGKLIVIRDFAKEVYDELTNTSECFGTIGAINGRQTEYIW